MSTFLSNLPNQSTKDPNQSSTSCVKDGQSNNSSVTVTNGNPETDLTGSLSADFKFNFQITDNKVLSKTIEKSDESATDKGDISLIPTNFMEYEKSDNSFRFNFS